MICKGELYLRESLARRKYTVYTYIVLYTA
jgi:hypothetical protein